MTREESDKLSKQLLWQVTNKLLTMIDGREQVTLREKVFTDITRFGKEIQIQIVVTDVEYLEDFETEVMKIRI